MLQRTALLLIVLALSIPLGVTAQNQGNAVDAQRETTDVTFYGHVFSVGVTAPMPANTEAPIGEDNFGIGLGGNCAQDCDQPGFNSLALFSTAGFVDVSNAAEFNQNGNYAQFHNERGQTKDIVLDTTRSISASVYVTLDMHGWPVGVVNGYGTNCALPHPPDVPCLYPYWGWDPGITPDVVVKATLYMANLGAHGSDASAAPPVAEAIESGDAQVIAEGTWGPELVMNGVPGAENVNEFVVDLGIPQLDTIPRDQDFFLVFTIYQETAGVNYQVRSGVRWWSGEFFPPTFTLPVKNAFDVERVIPNFAHGKLAILGVMNTPWGSYDIDPNSVQLTVEGSRGEIPLNNLNRFGDFSVAHGGHYLPINLTWIWDYNKDGVEPGVYTATVSAHNFQHSATASCTATFELKRTTANAPLTPGKVEEGVCGAQSATDEFLETIRDGTEQADGT